MEKSVGKETSKIWLIGDSPSESCKNKVNLPLDPRHSTIHSIWTPIHHHINDCLFNSGLRLRDSSLFIRNALAEAGSVTEKDKNDLDINFQKYKPIIVITFGYKAFTTVYNVVNKEKVSCKSKQSPFLGNHFELAIKNFDERNINVFPLLHASVARGKFIETQAGFCNIMKDEYKDAEKYYFRYVGRELGELLNRECFKTDMDLTK
jgi:hypothetical protein